MPTSHHHVTQHVMPAKLMYKCDITGITEENIFPLVSAVKTEKQLYFSLHLGDQQSCSGMELELIKLTWHTT